MIRYAFDFSSMSRRFEIMTHFLRLCLWGIDVLFVLAVFYSPMHDISYDNISNYIFLVVSIEASAETFLSNLRAPSVGRAGQAKQNSALRQARRLLHLRAPFVGRAGQTKQNSNHCHESFLGSRIL